MAAGTLEEMIGAPPGDIRSLFGGGFQDLDLVQEANGSQRGNCQGSGNRTDVKAIRSILMTRESDQKMPVVVTDQDARMAKVILPIPLKCQARARRESRQKAIDPGET
jgi:hypothetical protein